MSLLNSLANLFQQRDPRRQAAQQPQPQAHAQQIQVRPNAYSANIGVPTNTNPQLNSYQNARPQVGDFNPGYGPLQGTTSYGGGAFGVQRQGYGIGQGVNAQDFNYNPQDEQQYWY